MSDPDSSDKPKVGRVRHDAGGRAIWEWAMDSGRQAIDSTSRLLKKLELTGITLMGDEAKPWENKPGAGRPAPREPDAPPAPRESTHGPDPAAGGSKGFNPYDTRTPVGRSPPQKPASTHRPAMARPPARKKPGLLARLLGRK